MRLGYFRCGRNCICGLLTLPVAHASVMLGDRQGERVGSSETWEALAMFQE